jgi:Tol biopolymer transport system component
VSTHGASACLLVALVACKSERAQPTPAVESGPQLPGTLYVIEGDALVRYQAGTRVVIEESEATGARLFASPQSLPDGRVVAIASRGDGSAGSEQLALIARDGRVERLGPMAAQVRDPAVDPRGRFIVVAANIDGHSDLYQVELDGSARRLTNDPEGNYHPAFAGDVLVHVSSRDGDSEVYRGSQRLTTFHRDDWYPTPSPRGDLIAFLSDREGPPRVFLMAPDGTNLRRLTDRTADDVEESSPTWSRDGRSLAYVAGNHVFVHDVAANTARTLTAPGARELEPSFSPDGQWLAVARMRGNDSDVWALRLPRGEPVLIAKNARLPRWFAPQKR